RVAVARTVILRLGVADDARRDQAGARRDAAGKFPECRARGDLRDPGTVAHHVVDVRVVGRGIDVDQLLRDPPGHRRVAAHDAAVHHADGHTCAGVTLLL